MKKTWLKKILPSYLLFALVTGLWFNISPRELNAATTNCVDSTGVDYATNTPCSLVVKPCPANGIDPVTKKSCRTTPITNTGIDSFKPVKKGERSIRVEIIQRALQALGFNTKIDGIFGSQTERQIKLAQKKLKLKRIDGIAGTNTINELKKALASNTAIISLLRKVKLDPADPTPGSTSGITGSSGATGSSSGAGEDREVHTVCGPNGLGNTPIDVTATLTADNWYSAYVGKADGSELNLVGQDITNVSTFSNDRALAWVTSQTHTFNIPADRNLFLINFNDDWIDNGVIGQFIYKDASGNTKLDITKVSNWEMMITQMDKLAKISDVTTSMLEQEIKDGDWVPTISLGKNGISPWGSISGISAVAEWLESAGVRRDSKKITIYRTKMSGAGGFDSCTSDTCPPGTVGTPPNCQVPTSCPAGTHGTPPNCVPNTCPAGTTGTPPNCTPSICPVGHIGTPPNCTPPPALDIGVQEWCRGLWPAIHMKVLVTLSDTVVIVGTPYMKIKKTDGTYGAKLKYTGISADKKVLTFEYVVPSPNTDNYLPSDYDGKLVFDTPFTSGNSIKREITGVPIDPTGEWDATEVAGSPAHCPTALPVPTDSLDYSVEDLAIARCFTQEVTGASGSKVATFTIGTNKPVFTPSALTFRAYSIEPNPPGALIASYVSGSWTNQLKFSVTQTPSISDASFDLSINKLFNFPNGNLLKTVSMDGSTAFPHSIAMTQSLLACTGAATIVVPH